MVSQIPQKEVTGTICSAKHVFAVTARCKIDIIVCVVHVFWVLVDQTVITRPN